MKEIGYYENMRAGLGARFRIAVTDGLKNAGESPLTGKPGVANTRRILVKGFPFAVVYIMFDVEVVVYAVSHLSRKPGYWLGRIER